MTNDESNPILKLSREQRAAAMNAFFDGVQTEQALHRAVLQILLLQLAKDGGPEMLQAYRDDVANLLAALNTSFDPVIQQKHRMEMEAACQVFFSQIAKAAGFIETQGEPAN